MAEMPAVEPYTAPSHLIEQCIAKASRARGVPEPILYTIYALEGGKVGSQNLNSNGTFDMGPFQINTINLEIVRAEFGDVSRHQIASDICLNTESAAYLIARHLKRNKGYLYSAVGDYHTRTPEYRIIYQRKFFEKYPAILNSLAKNGKTVNYANYGFSGYLMPTSNTSDE